MTICLVDSFVLLELEAVCVILGYVRGMAVVCPDDCSICSNVLFMCQECVGTCSSSHLKKVCQNGTITV